MDSKARQWTDLLSFVREKSKNQILLFDCFFEHFAAHPTLFYEIVVLFRQELTQEKDNEKRQRLSRQYLKVLSPLLERFGFFEEKSLIDDLCFEITDPTAYKKIDTFLLAYKKKKGKILNQVLSVLEELLKEEGYTFKIKARYKSFFSIHQKLQKRMVESALRLKDVFGFRIILDDPSDRICFDVAELLHDRFYPVPDFFKDYISVPRTNGYQSIHTGLLGVVPHLDIPIEVQIRTKRMDEYAEKGFAAHWIYAKDKRTQWIANPQKILESLHGNASSKTPEENVYFFSCKGDIFKLEKGATILDFAYHLHTDLGDHAVSALINGQERPLQTPLAEGDRVQLLESEERQVHRSWLTFIHTSYARKKIQESLKHR
ncbi:MAG: TGS domain-containing protein [Candidatus Gracilibacteria bacterium]